MKKLAALFLAAHLTCCAGINQGKPGNPFKGQKAQVLADSNHSGLRQLQVFIDGVFMVPPKKPEPKKPERDPEAEMRKYLGRLDQPSRLRILSSLFGGVGDGKVPDFSRVGMVEDVKRLRRICGSNYAIGCFSPDKRRIYIPKNNPSLLAILAHEIGHSKDRYISRGRKGGELDELEAYLFETLTVKRFLESFDTNIPFLINNIGEMEFAARRILQELGVVTSYRQIVEGYWNRIVPSKKGSQRKIMVDIGPHNIAAIMFGILIKSFGYDVERTYDFVHKSTDAAVARRIDHELSSTADLSDIPKNIRKFISRNWKRQDPGDLFKEKFQEQALSELSKSIEHGGWSVIRNKRRAAEYVHMRNQDFFVEAIFRGDGSIYRVFFYQRIRDGARPDITYSTAFNMDRVILFPNIPYSLYTNADAFPRVLDTRNSLENELYWRGTNEFYRKVKNPMFVAGSVYYKKIKQLVLGLVEKMKRE